MDTFTVTIYFVDNQFLAQPSTLQIPNDQTVATIQWDFEATVPVEYRFGPAIILSNLKSFLSYSTTNDGRQAIMTWLNRNPTRNVALSTTYGLLIVNTVAKDQAPIRVTPMGVTAVDPEIQDDPIG